MSSGSGNDILNICTKFGLLGLGLLAVDLRLGTVTVLAEPATYRPRPNLPQRRRLVAEHRRRKGDPTQGGSTRQPIMTAYRQRTIACAEAMRDGPKRPRELRGLAEDAGAILLRNVYGWFERVEKGLYALSESGRLAIGESEFDGFGHGVIVRSGPRLQCGQVTAF